MDKQIKEKTSKKKLWFHNFSLTSILAISIVAGGILWFEQPKDNVNKVVAVTKEKTVLAEITVYKSATCTCCHKWVKYLENKGFIVKAYNRTDMDTVKKSLGVMPGLASCHTAMVDGYLIEGHVPASDIRRLLAEKPNNVLGLTAPGMPRYSPGMQPKGLAPKGYDVLTFDKQGNTQLFNSY